ncbi:MAG TPA: helix-turn-helix transcriptional regulator, partial [Candidatus Scatomorpha merdipullorum]|nr:helix-turn-helix transcriptional regulator [Candidatus Scatomorpha merdipullorum]
MNILDRIQALRRSRGITQEQLADAVGVSRQAVSKWEAEQASPDLERIVAMAEFFDVTTDYLLRGIEPAKEQRSRASAR